MAYFIVFTDEFRITNLLYPDHLCGVRDHWQIHTRKTEKETK